MGFYEDHVFPPLLDLATRPLRRDRAQLLADARGRVLELGAGTGANLDFYPESAGEVVLLEPSAAMLDRARARAGALARPGRFGFTAAGAESLPFEDASFDTVIACLVFCTIPDPLAAAREARRVLRPGGRLLVLEHVRSPDAAIARVQRRVDGLWTRLACGCHLDRDTRATFRGAGLVVDEVEAFDHPKIPALARAMIRGLARR